ncbi:UDP-glucose 4-epimerase [Crossiella equi]|uniref:UDP-glucose 4-epimerase n=1 Tax=Crossiella equi TaxID=130796 RepID=A0ABS5A5Q1_9PSEU|nr:NAD-dependent epimerase/dehydratase family protein [Crossiella equi]MBP2471918.1 UDP-glucose 4-epimerase [Crossiella equi]
MTATASPTALVTGAAGFIGSHLVEHLLGLGWRVRGLDDFSAGTVDNLRTALAHPDFELTEGSVTDERLTRRTAAGTTHVFHLAGRVGAFYVERNPERVVEESVRATRSVLGVCADARLPLFFASTSEIYGNSARQPLREDADVVIAPPANPRSSYAFAKGVGELLVNAHVRAGRGPAVVGRLFNTIGVRQAGQYGLVVPRFLDWALAGQPLVVHGDGTQTRSFTHVGDVVRAITATLTVPAAHGHTINIGSDRETTIADLAQLVLRLTGSDSVVQHEPYAQAHGEGARDILRRLPSTEQLRTLTGLACTTPVEAAVQSMVEARRAPALGGTV